MKTLFMLLALSLTAQVAAAEIHLGSISLSGLNADRIDSQLMQGSVKVSAKDLKCRSGGYDHEDICFLRTVASKTFLLPGLKTENEQLIFESANGNVVCGNYGVSRVLRRRTLFLTGNCQVETKIESAGRNSALLVNFVTR